MKDKLAVLPSAQPEQCSDCIANGGDWECDHIHCHKGQLPSAQSERRKGEWIVDNVETEHCSVCKHRFYISALFAVGGNDEPPSCPWCGADMT